MDTLRALKEYFGHDTFRPGQETLVNALLGGRDVLSIMPTGAGKSLCYQLPALMLEGITLVISPLISLMKDQVAALRQCGIPAAFLNSSLTAAQQAEALRRAAQGQYKLIYVAPERLLTPRFLEFAGSVTISMVIVDEAHCISQWGQDFRPRYLDICTLVESLEPRPVVGAFTATATKQVQRDILELLKLRNPSKVVTSFDRKNLFLGVEHPRSKAERDESLLAFLTRHRGESGIIYCISRNSVDALTQMLQQHGFSAAGYHGGVTKELRDTAQEDFLYDRVQIMVATNAFGMGIDKSNVSFVVHYQLPRDLEGYYQEAGRAGRDGSPAECLLFYRKSDLPVHKFLIQQSGLDNEELDGDTREALQQRSLRRLDRMVDYCTTTRCLRKNLLSYFGEVLEEDCGCCSNCLRGWEETDCTVPAQKYLSCVVRLKRLGIPPRRSLVEDTLRGIYSQETLPLGKDRLPTFGLLFGIHPEELETLYRALCSHGLLAEREDGTLAVTERAKPVLAGQRTFTLRRRAKKPLPKPQSTARSPIPQTVDETLLARLKETRRELAKAQGVPAYVICADASLRELCVKRPSTLDGLQSVSGFGTVKVRRYGPAFLKVLTRYAAEQKHG